MEGPMWSNGQPRPGAGVTNNGDGGGEMATNHGDKSLKSELWWSKLLRLWWMYEHTYFNLAYKLIIYIYYVYIYILCIHIYIYIYIGYITHISHIYIYIWYIYIYIHMYVVGRIKTQQLINGGSDLADLVPSQVGNCSSRRPKTTASRLVQQPLLSTSQSFDVDPIRPARQNRTRGILPFKKPWCHWGIRGWWTAWWDKGNINRVDY